MKLRVAIAAVFVGLLQAGTASAVEVFGASASHIETSGPAIIAASGADPNLYRSYISTSTRSAATCDGLLQRCILDSSAAETVYGTSSGTFGASQYSVSAGTLDGYVYYDLSSVAAVVDPGSDPTGAKLKVAASAGIGDATVKAGVAGDVNVYKQDADPVEDYDVNFTIYPEFSTFLSPYNGVVNNQSLQYMMHVEYGFVSFDLNEYIDYVQATGIDQNGYEYYYQAPNIVSYINCGHCDQFDDRGDYYEYQHQAVVARYRLLDDGGIAFSTSWWNDAGPMHLNWWASVSSFGGGLIDASHTTTFAFNLDPGLVVTSDFGFARANLAAAASSGPEPSSWSLLILGFGALGLRLRSRRRETCARA